jgi:hypothetical protein
VHSESDRDTSVERLLRGSLQARGKPASPESCLDAETLAAWAEGTLAREQFAMAEAHLSDCARCQTLLAAFVKTTPPQPESWWRRGLGVRWLVPLTAAATAALLWVVVPHDQRSALVEQKPAQTQAAAPVTLQPAEPIGAPPASQQAEPAAAPSPSSPTASPDSDLRAQAKPENQPAESASAKSAQGGQARRKSVALEGERAAADRIDGAAAREAPKEIDKTEQRLGPDRLGALNETLTVSGEAPLASAAPRPATDIVSPDSSIRWRIGVRGSVQRSTDGGSTWEAQPTGVTTDLTAGMSPSPSVCWVVGRAGTVLLTSDGRQWQRVMFPESADLTAVQAIDARTATVATADGRFYRTADGGVTWTRVQGF